MKAGLAARIAARRSFASPPSSVNRWRHLTAQSSKELGSVNKLRTSASPSGLAAASHSRRKSKVKSTPLRMEVQLEEFRRADRRTDLLDTDRPQGRNSKHGAELLGSL